ncbi:hypothetical protein M422DRAFT_54902 [Sphaerobolus stellatus SS14]|uniref:Uncharacterized protein n=1 Tax=Sphaerobolus stellatus (strain SS14) TaxID=990650 RepID=A0A0C9UQY8_SPHS4|nr:hypothetical protein M422DRAFT_54902 [Sphaerobolus stellatus SS14]
MSRSSQSHTSYAKPASSQHRMPAAYPPKYYAPAMTYRPLPAEQPVSRAYSPYYGHASSSQSRTPHGYYDTYLSSPSSYASESRSGYAHSTRSSLSPSPAPSPAPSYASGRSSPRSTSPMYPPVTSPHLAPPRGYVPLPDV